MISTTQRMEGGLLAVVDSKPPIEGMGGGREVGAVSWMTDCCSKVKGTNL